MIHHAAPRVATTIAALLVGADALAAQSASQSAAQSAAPSAAPSDGVRVCAGGDVTLGTNLPTFALRDAVPAPPDALRRRPPRQRRGRARPAPEPVAIDTIPSRWTAAPGPLLAPLRPLVDDADVLLLNVEGAVGEGDAPSKCGPRSTLCYAFRMPIAAARALRELGDSGTVVVGNVANNHSRDVGLEGLDSTVAHLVRGGVVPVGMDTIASVAITLAGDTVAFLGFATSGTDTPDVRDLEAVRRHVARAAARWPRLVVTMHMGGEGAAAQRTRDATERYAGGDRGNPVAFARTVVEAGADLVVGHGPHVLRAAEWRGPVPVFYSLGNLVTYGPFSNRAPLDRGAIACAVLGPDGRARTVELRPTVQRAAGEVAPDPERRALVLVDSLSRLDFGATGARVRPDGQVVRRPAPTRRR